MNLDFLMLTESNQPRIIRGTLEEEQNLHLKLRYFDHYFQWRDPGNQERQIMSTLWRLHEKTVRQMFGKIFATMNKIPSEIDAGWSSGPQLLTTAGKPRNSNKIFAGSFPKFLSSNVRTIHRTSTEYRYSRIIFRPKTVLFISTL